MRKVPMGVIGCGRISSIYLKNCTQTFAILDVLACADLVPELAQQRAAEFQIPHAYTVEELLADPNLEIILNLTSPKAHAAVNRQVLQAGKHVYTEKPFALTREDADQVLELAQTKNLRVGSAPDTFLGGGLQTCRKLIDEGAIGIPYAASGSVFMGSAARFMPPNIQEYFQYGWDPLFDMAPYYLTAMVFLFGAVRRVTGSTGNVQHAITITNPQSPLYGQSVPVEAPMNVAATLDFDNGMIASLQVAKESASYTPRFEVYGTEGILYAPDPNAFGGAIRIKQADGTITDVVPTHGFTENSRGIGVADMAYALGSGRPHRASGNMAWHVVDVSVSILEASQTERHVAIMSRCERPAPLPLGLTSTELDA